MPELLAAFQFLTVLPVKRSFTAQQMALSTVYFPVVGLAIGLVLAAFNYVFSLILPHSVVNIFLIALLALMSGGLHLDGVADTMDGLAGHRTAEQRLEIMRDSRIGGFGAIGLVLLLLIEYVTLNSVPNDWRTKTEVLILTPVLSRWAMVYAIYAFPYARPAGLGRAFKDSVNGQQLVLATIIALILSVALFLVAGLVILVGCWVIVTLLALFLKKQLTGLTGDTYGAINEVVTAGVFLLVVLLSFNHWLI